MGLANTELMSPLSRVFLKGLAISVPIAGTVAILVWLVSFMESVTHSLFGSIMPVSWRFPGAGMMLGIFFVLAVGILAHFWLFRRFGALIDAAFAKAPLVKAIYNSLKDFSDFAFPSDAPKKKLGKSVIVHFEKLGISTVGFEMVSNMSEHAIGHELVSSENKVAVYLPMSYQIGGYMVIVEKENITPLDLSVEEMLRLTMTAGIVGSKKSD